MISVEERRNVRGSRNALDKVKGLQKGLEVSRSMGAFKTPNLGDCLD